MPNKRLLIFILTVVLLVAGCGKNGYTNSSYTEDIEKVLLFETDETGQDMCMVVANEDYLYNYAIIPNKYIALIDTELEYRYVRVGTNSIHNKIYQKYDINVYSVGTKELIKTYTLEDIKKILPKGHVLYGIFGADNIQMNGHDYLLLSAVEYQKNPTEDYIEKCVTINLETDEMELREDVSRWWELERTSEKAWDFDSRLDIFHEWTQEQDGYQFLAANGFEPLFSQTEVQFAEKRLFNCTTGMYTKGFRNEGIAEIRMLTNSLPEKNEELYNKFPELREYQGKEGYTVVIYLGGFPTAEESLRLCMEDGQEISFEECVMDGKYSKDGQPHEIRSFEEFYEWYNPDWNPAKVRKS